jgi:hypothetical protein
VPEKEPVKGRSPEIRDRTAKNAKMPRREFGRTTLEAVVVVPGTIHQLGADLAA